MSCLYIDNDVQMFSNTQMCSLKSSLDTYKGACDEKIWKSVKKKLICSSTSETRFYGQNCSEKQLSMNSW